MRHGIAGVLVVLGALALGGGARAADPGGARLPARPFVAAKPGDWSTGLVTTRVLGRSQPRRIPAAPVTWRIAAVTSALVTVLVETERGAVVETRTFPRLEGPPLADFLGLPGRTFSDVTVEDDELTWQQRGLACKHVRAVARRPGVEGEERIELWVSRDVAGPGVVAATVATILPDAAFEQTFSLAGWGRGAEVEAGTAPPEGPAPIASRVAGTRPARLCDSCGFGAAARTCVACDAPFAKVEGKACSSCVPREDACVRCGRARASVPARLCDRCAFGDGRDLCVRCSR